MPMQTFHAGHVHFMLFMSISFASGTQSKLVFQWNMGLRMTLISCHNLEIAFFSHIFFNVDVSLINALIRLETFIHIPETRLE